MHFITQSFRYSMWFLYVGLTVIVVMNSLGYFYAIDEMVFLLDREGYAERGWWRMALVVHVAGGLICLVAASTQFSGVVLKKFRSLHKVMGRLYAVSVLILLCPAGMILAIVAKGGLVGQIGFLLLGVLTWYTTWKGVELAIRGDIRRHRVWMVRSFALIASALSFRLFQAGLYLTGMEDGLNYQISLWLSIVVNIAVAEVIIAKPWKKFSNKNKQLSNKNKLINPQVS